MLEDDLNDPDEWFTVQFDGGSTKKLEELAERVYELEVREGKRKPEDFIISPGEIVVAAIDMFEALISKRCEGYKIGVYKKVNGKIKFETVSFYLEKRKDSQEDERVL